VVAILFAPELRLIAMDVKFGELGAPGTNTMRTYRWHLTAVPNDNLLLVVHCSSLRLMV